MSNGESSRRILTISQLTSLVRISLESQFSDLWIEGEVSNFRAPASGHLYFALKDETSQVRAVLFRSGASRLRCSLHDGLLVVVRGRLSVYEPRGEYQLILEYVEPKGFGALQLAFEQLKARLAREGLFDQSRKRPLPAFPRRVGVVTSPSGAAIRDILSVLHRRCPILHVMIVPVPVQGEGAATQIADGIRRLSESRAVDVVIVGRGGGSPEDLWCFNDEVVVRAIVASKVPVVSAVGHEIDCTLADFAADYRAPTPSAAAEAVAPVLSDLVERLRELRGRASRIVRQEMAASRNRLERVADQLRVLQWRVQHEGQRLDEAVGTLTHQLQIRVGRLHRRLLVMRHELLSRNPLLAVKQAVAVVPQLLRRLVQQMRLGLAGRRQRLAANVGSLDSLSPLAVLGRGYSIVRTVPEGKVLRRASEVRVGRLVRARLAVGELDCVVKQIRSHSSP
jgi:exodeoxyribonuclease VII large subunit